MKPNGYIRNTLEINEIKKPSISENKILFENKALLECENTNNYDFFKSEKKQPTVDVVNEKIDKKVKDEFYLVIVFLVMFFVLLFFGIDYSKSKKASISALSNISNTNELSINELKRSLESEPLLISKNSLTTDEIKKIAENKVEKLFNMNYIDYKNQIVGFSSMFKNDGINKYLDELQKNSYLENMKESNGYFIVSKANLVSNSILTKQRSDNKKYYVVSVSIVEQWITYKMKKINKRIITLQLEENPDNKNDLLISNIIISKPLE